MAIDQTVWTTIQDQKNKVLKIEDPALDVLTKELAFHVAMLAAAISDPMDETDDQEEMLQYLQDVVDSQLDEYMTAVNSHL